MTVKMVMEKLTLFKIRKSIQGKIRLLRITNKLRVFVVNFIDERES